MMFRLWVIKCFEYRGRYLLVARSECGSYKSGPATVESSPDKLVVIRRLVHVNDSGEHIISIDPPAFSSQELVNQTLVGESSVLTPSAIEFRRKIATGELTLKQAIEIVKKKK